MVSIEKIWDSFAWDICLFYPIIYLFNNLYHDGYLFYSCVLSRFSHVQLFATLWIVASGSSIHGILQMRILELVTIPFSRGIFLIQGSKLSFVNCTAGGFFTTSTTLEVPIYFILCIILQHNFLIQIFLDLARGGFFNCPFLTYLH